MVFVSSRCAKKLISFIYTFLSSIIGAAGASPGNLGSSEDGVDTSPTGAGVGVGVGVGIGPGVSVGGTSTTGLSSVAGTGVSVAGTSVGT